MKEDIRIAKKRRKNKKELGNVSENITKLIMQYLYHVLAYNYLRMSE